MSSESGDKMNDKVNVTLGKPLTKEEFQKEKEDQRHQMKPPPVVFDQQQFQEQMSKITPQQMEHMKKQIENR